MLPVVLIKPYPGASSLPTALAEWPEPDQEAELCTASGSSHRRLWAEPEPQPITGGLRGHSSCKSHPFASKDVELALNVTFGAVQTSRWPPKNAIFVSGRHVNMSSETVNCSTRRRPVQSGLAVGVSASDQRHRCASDDLKTSGMVVFERLIRNTCPGR